MATSSGDTSRPAGVRRVNSANRASESGIDAQAIDRPGGIFVRLLDQIAPEDRILMQSVARVIVSDTRGTLAEQIKRPGPPSMRMPPLMAEEAP